MFDLSLQGLKGDTCHSHSSTLAEHSHATYHYLSILVAISNTFQASNLQALALLQDFDKG